MNELPPVGFELGTFGLQQRSESDTLATAPARHMHEILCWFFRSVKYDAKWCHIVVTKLPTLNMVGGCRYN